MVDEHGATELIEGLRKRDTGSLATVYDLYGQIVYSLFLRITGEQSVAEDLVQQLFSRVWDEAPSHSVKGPLGVWILSVARHMAISHVRSARSRVALRSLPIEDTKRVRSDKDSRQPEAILDQVRTVRAVFSNLDPNEKRVVELAYYEGFSQSEIAERLKQPLETIKSWMHSGLGKLRTAVKGGGV